MEGYEFEVAVQHLGAVAALFEKAPLQAMRDHLSYAESVAPLFGDAAQGSQRIRDLRRFIARALSFQAECQSYRARIVRQLSAGESVSPGVEGA